MNNYKYVSTNYDPHTLKEYLDSCIVETYSMDILNSAIIIQTEADEATVNAAMDAYLAQDNKLLKLKADTKLLIKAEANKRIAALVPDRYGISNVLFAEINALMRAVGHLKKKVDNTATAEELTELDSFQSIEGQITAIREASNLIETEIDNAATLDGFVVENHPQWP